MKKVVFTFVMIFVIGSFLIAEVETLWAAEKVITWGIPISLTGPFSRQGTRDKRAYDLYEEWVNKKGGIKVGGQTYNVKLIFYDDKSDATTAAKLTEKLITQDKVDFLYAATNSVTAYLSSAVSEKYKYPAVAPMATGQKVWGRGFKYFWGTFPQPGIHWGAGVFELANATLKTENNRPVKVAVLWQNAVAFDFVEEHSQRLMKK